MLKCFCNKCNEEMPHDNNEEPVVEGYIHFGRERRKIWVSVESITDEHFCKNCQIDAIKALDYRPDPNLPKPSESFWEDPADEGEEGTEIGFEETPPLKPKKPSLGMREKEDFLSHIQKPERKPSRITPVIPKKNGGNS